MPSGVSVVPSGSSGGFTGHNNTNIEVVIAAVVCPLGIIICLAICTIGWWQKRKIQRSQMASETGKAASQEDLEPGPIRMNDTMRPAAHRSTSEDTLVARPPTALAK